MRMSCVSWFSSFSIELTKPFLYYCLNRNWHVSAFWYSSPATFLRWQDFFVGKKCLKNVKWPFSTALRIAKKREKGRWWGFLTFSKAVFFIFLPKNREQKNHPFPIWFIVGYSMFFHAEISICQSVKSCANEWI